MIEIYSKQIEDQLITIFDIPNNLVDKVKDKVIKDGYTIDINGSARK